jgi:toxin ParE1/3/4
MPRSVVAPAAVEDIESILAWTHERFVERARLRYEALLIRAIIDIADQPNRAGSSRRPEIAAFARTYNLAHSRKRVTGGVGRVKQPRHFILYRTRADGTVEIGRVLHDSFDLRRHLRQAFRGQFEEGRDPGTD